MKKKSTGQRPSHSKKVSVRRRRRSGLAAAGFKGAGMNALKGLAGGLLFGVIAKLADKDGNKPNNRIIAGLAASVVTAMFIKQPFIAAGIAGATAATVAQKIPGLNDGQEVEFISPESLMNDNRPDLVYGDDGQAYFPLQDGNFFPLNDYQASTYNRAKLTNANIAAIGRPSPGSFQQVFPGYLNPGFF